MNTETNLRPDERVVIEAKPPWGALIIAPILSIVFGCLIAWLGFSQMGKWDMGSWLALLGMLTVLGGFGSILPNFSGTTTQFIVTNKRIIAKTGLILRHNSELFVSGLKSANLDQSFTARAWNYGTIILVPTEGKGKRFPNITKPKQVQEVLNALITGQPLPQELPSPPAQPTPRLEEAVQAGQPVVVSPAAPATPAVEIQGDTKQCPACGERIKAEANICRFCKTRF